MISEITMKNVATYSKNGIVIKNLAKLNYFYGNNGCGKSTISKYLQTFSSEKKNNLYTECACTGFDKNKEDILVFNQNFIDENFRNSDLLQGVFLFHKANLDIDEQIKINEKEISDNIKAKELLEHSNEEIDYQRFGKDSKSGLRGKIWETCFNKRKTFDTFAKIKLDYSGRKESNFLHIQKLLEKDLENKKNLEDLASIYKKLYEEDVKEIDVSINIEKINEFFDFEENFSALLNEVIIGKDDVPIAEMIKKLQIKPWVEKGKEYLFQTKNICPFCQQEIKDSTFVNQLNQIFDETYNKKVQKIKTLQKELEQKYNNLSLNIENVSNVYNKDNKVTSLQKSLRNNYDNNLKIINAKLEATNERKELIIDREKLLSEIQSINIDIDKNNSFFHSIDNQRKLLIDDIWTYLAIECKSDIEKYNKEDTLLNDKMQKNSAKITEIENIINALNAKNIDLRTKTVNTKDAVDNINNLLKNSGFMGFEICEKNKVNNISQYYLSRKGITEGDNVFNTLSEGEKNFIAFLYFYQLCLGETELSHSSTKKKIIVIDDPVSSMDSQVLFIVSTLINLLIKRGENHSAFSNNTIMQVFIFSHNLYFYKEIALSCRPICKSRNHFLIQKNDNNNTTVIEKGRNYEALDDYSLMWLTIKEIKSNVQENDHSQNILIANIFRRILESYANFRGLGHDAWATVLSDEKANTEYYLKCAFISMINDESHKVSPLDNFYFQKIHNETPLKLFDVFENIFKTIDFDHYKKMIGTGE